MAAPLPSLVLVTMVISTALMQILTQDRSGGPMSHPLLQVFQKICFHLAHTDQAILDNNPRVALSEAESTNVGPISQKPWSYSMFLQDSFK